MKKYIVCFLMAVLMVMTVLTLPACRGNSGQTDPPPPDDGPELPPEDDGPVTDGNCKLGFASADGVSYILETRPGERVEKGTVVTFSLKVSTFYEGEATVTVNGERLSPSAEGVYSFTVSADTTVSVSGITMKANAITGSGTSPEDPFVITTPVDIIYIADRVNSGDPTYRGAFYCLENDISFSGERIKIIGSS